MRGKKQKQKTTHTNTVVAVYIHPLPLLWPEYDTRSFYLKQRLNKSWEQYYTKQQLYGHLSPISQTIQAGHNRKSKDKLSNILVWIPIHGHNSVSWPAKTYIKQLCMDTGCRLEDLPRAMVDRDEWQERLKRISTSWRKLIGIQFFI